MDLILNYKLNNQFYRENHHKETNTQEKTMTLIESIVNFPPECTLSFQPGCTYDGFTNSYICGPIGATGCRGSQGSQGPAPPQDPEDIRRREEEERKRVEEAKRRYKRGVVISIMTPNEFLYHSFSKMILDYQNEYPEERLQIIPREPRLESTRSPKPEHTEDIECRRQLQAKRDARIQELLDELESLGYDDDDIGYGHTEYPESERILAEWYNVTTIANYAHSGFEIRCHCESNLYKTLVEKGIYDEKKVVDKILGRC